MRLSRNTDLITRPRRLKFSPSRTFQVTETSILFRRFSRASSRYVCCSPLKEATHIYQFDILFSSGSAPQPLTCEFSIALLDPI